jgi:hypothetical protein
MPNNSFFLGKAARVKTRQCPILLEVTLNVIGVVLVQLFNRIPGQLLRTCEPARYVICDSRRWENLQPSPPPPNTVVQRRPQQGSREFPDSSSPGQALSPIGRSGPHTAKQNGGDLYPYDMKPARTVLCD